MHNVFFFFWPRFSQISYNSISQHRLNLRNERWWVGWWYVFLRGSRGFYLKDVFIEKCHFYVLHYIVPIFVFARVVYGSHLDWSWRQKLFRCNCSLNEYFQKVMTLYFYDLNRKKKITTMSSFQVFLGLKNGLGKNKSKIWISWENGLYTEQWITAKTV